MPVPWAAGPPGRCSGGLESIAGRSERLFERPRRPKRARTGIFERLCRPKWLQEGSAERFWSLLGRFWVPRRVDFSDFSMTFRSSGPIRAKKRRTTKNVRKSYVFIRFSRIRVCAHDTKIDRKIVSNVLFKRVVRRIALGTLFFRACECQNGPRGLPGAP